MIWSLITFDNLQSCGGKVWIKVAKYLTEDVPYRLKSDDVKDVESLLSIFKSAPAELKEFIKWWVAEVCRQEDGSSEEEKKGGLVMKVFVSFAPFLFL